MLIRQSVNTFIRIYDGGEFGYITNQLTCQDRIYDQTGAEFLKQITRQPQSIDDIIERLCAIYGEGNRHCIQHDFKAFANDLADLHFVNMGKTEDELNQNDILFTYEVDNPKTLAIDFTQSNTQGSRTTQDYLLQHDRKHPRLACLQIELTSRCNERCIHCYIPNASKDKGCYLSFEHFKNIIDQFSEMNGLIVGLTGGEALMNKDFIPMLRYCRKKDLKITLLSNLTLLNDEIVKALKETNVSLVQVSLYSMNHDIHDAITKQRGSFIRTKNAIEKLRKEDVPVLISCPVMKANRKDYISVMDYAHSMKMQAQTDYVMMAESDFDKHNLTNRLSLKETEELLHDMMSHDRIENLAPQESMPLAVSSKEELERMPMCGAGINDLSISAEGNVYPCAGWEGYVVGNVFNQSLKEIWETSTKLNEIRKIKHKDFPKCLDCEAQDFCNMCLVRNYNESHGDMFKINNHFCKVAFLNKRLVEEWMKKKESKLSEVNDR